MFSDQTAEIRLLAACIDESGLTLRIKKQLFTGERQAIFEAFAAAHITYGEITYEGVEQFYPRTLPPEIEIARGAKAEPIIDRLVYYARKRQLVDVSNGINVLLTAPTLDDVSINKVLHIDPLTSSSDTTLTAATVEFSAELRKKLLGQYEFVHTGIPFLDEMLGGEWPRSGLAIIIGEGGAGKTALVCNSARRMADIGLSSLFISLEMTKSRLVGRLVADDASVDGNLIRLGRLTQEEQDRVDESMNRILGLDMHIDDKPGMTIDYIVDQMRAHKEEHDIKAVFIDYLQIIGNDTSLNMYELYGYWTQRIRDAAKRYDIAAILLAQQNRGGEGMHSIAGSSRPSQIADVVMELTCPPDMKMREIRPVEIELHKNRDGALASQTIPYHAKYLRFITDEENNQTTRR